MSQRRYANRVPCDCTTTTAGCVVFRDNILTFSPGRLGLMVVRIRTMQVDAGCFDAWNADVKRDVQRTSRFWFKMEFAYHYLALGEIPLMELRNLSLIGYEASPGPAQILNGAISSQTPTLLHTSIIMRTGSESFSLFSWGSYCAGLGYAEVWRPASPADLHTFKRHTIAIVDLTLSSVDIILAQLRHFLTTFQHHGLQDSTCAPPLRLPSRISVTEFGGTSPEILSGHQSQELRGFRRECKVNVSSSHVNKRACSQLCICAAGPILSFTRLVGPARRHGGDSRRNPSATRDLRDEGTGIVRLHLACASLWPGSAIFMRFPRRGERGNLRSCDGLSLHEGVDILLTEVNTDDEQYGSESIPVDATLSLSDPFEFLTVYGTGYSSQSAVVSWQGMPIDRLRLTTRSSVMKERRNGTLETCLNREVGAGWGIVLRSAYGRLGSDESWTTTELLGAERASSDASGPATENM
ncbi:hypothetical protein FISHEDRAFT_55468 [Fistulina hepatica ATCC 64428]|uniref:Uncharacterized protein n=1 Tax=Fistulina hepatica ATCC 64428 TaxID=1128425 RepID=A0A0D7AP82_9AGAR|nr:hypothetical protein FISHEDRAFT_55468 [Fistulina hepatica ATCC 64428]